MANDIEVPLRAERNDTDIAGDAVRALGAIETIPDTVQATVHNGHVTLTGKVPWMYQSTYAEYAMRQLRGVRGVHDYIDVAPRAVERDVRHRIVAAMHRNADVDARRITIAVDGHVATLTGYVDSWFQRDAAERAAASAAGIVRVDNRIVVEGTFDLEEAVGDELC